MSKKQAQTTLNQFAFTKQQKQKQINSKQSRPNQNQKQQQSEQSSISHRSSTQKLKQQDNNKNEKKRMFNVEFYTNAIKSDPQGDFIDNIHKTWWGNYKLLQTHHGYIQWLFPNSFTSRFNSRSFALSSQEQQIFRTNIAIAKRYVTSYQMILQFYGMKLKSKVTGQITQQRTVNFKQRYHATLLTSFHNHMRITRILCSMTMIGFGRYAKQLSLFLKQEIHGQNGNLKSLAKYNVDKDWKIYQDYLETQQDLNVYLKQVDLKSHQEKIALQARNKQENLKRFGADIQKSGDNQKKQGKNKIDQKQQLQVKHQQKNKQISNNKNKATLSPLKNNHSKNPISKQKQGKKQ